MRVDLARHRRLGADRRSIACRAAQRRGIPVSYVPARNTLMLALALGWAEVLGGARSVIGVNAVDYSGYPDCRPEFIRSFEALAALATKAGVEGARFHVHAPLIAMSKARIIRSGLHWGVDFAMTVSCYQADERGARLWPLRFLPSAARGLRQAAGDRDPTRYR